MIFDLTDEEIWIKAKIIAEKARNTAWENGFPISYRNELCIQDNMIIHEYADGVKYLVCVNPDNGNTQKVAIIPSIEK